MGGKIHILMQTCIMHGLMRMLSSPPWDTRLDSDAFNFRALQSSPRKRADDSIERGSNCCCLRLVSLELVARSGVIVRQTRGNPGCRGISLCLALASINFPVHCTHHSHAMMISAMV